MRKLNTLVAVIGVATCGQMWLHAQRPAAPPVAQGAAASNLIDYTTDGADIERSGWVKDEKILTRQNVGTLKLKWKLETGNQPRALHALMPVLVIGQLSTPGGVKQVGIVNGISDNLYAFDVEREKSCGRSTGTIRRRRAAAAPPRRSRIRSVSDSSSPAAAATRR